MSLFSTACAKILPRRLHPVIRRRRSWNVPLVATCVAMSTSSCVQHADVVAEAQRLNAPVKAVADQRVPVDTPHGDGLLPVYANLPIDKPEPSVKRVFIVMHGTLRNADVYFASGRRIVERAGDLGKDVMVVAPQFLTQSDARAFSLSEDTLAWTQEGWKGVKQPASPGQ